MLEVADLDEEEGLEVVCRCDGCCLTVLTKVISVVVEVNEATTMTKKEYDAIRQDKREDERVDERDDLWHSKMDETKSVRIELVFEVEKNEGKQNIENTWDRDI